jgi:hypothetical protein
MGKATQSVLVAILTLMLLTPWGMVSAAPQIRLTIAVHQPSAFFAVGNGLAPLISRNIPGVEATAQATGDAVETLRLIGTRRADLAITGTEAWNAFRGEGAFKDNPIPLRALTPLFNLFTQLVTIEGTGINTLADLRGKRVSITSTPGSPSDALFLRILTTAGIDHERDIRKERLGRVALEALALSVAALRDKKIDAFFWFGNVPTAEVLDLATTPGIRIKLIPLDSVVPAFQREFGNLYFKVTIQKEFYPGMTADVATVGNAVLLSAHQDFNADLAYQITKLIYEKRAELAQAQRFAQYITLIGVAGRSSIPFHPGAIRYFRERGVEGF